MGKGTARSNAALGRVRGRVSLGARVGLGLGWGKG